MTKVIKFYADWCGPCRIYAKVFEEVSEQLKDQAEFVNINIEKDDTGLSDEFKVESIPTTVILKGDQAKVIKGRLEAKDLRKLIVGE